MSATRLENDYDKLISHVDIDSDRVSCKSSQCSCSDCDSVNCFGKRNRAAKEQCQCANCKELKTCCSEISEKVTETKKDLEQKDSIPKKIIREIVTRETIESLKKVTETMYGLDKKEDFEVTLEKRPNITKKNDNLVNKNSVIKKKPLSNKEGNMEKTVSKKPVEPTEKPVVQKPSVYIDFPLDDNNTVTKLSAQVMDVPYKDLEESVSANDTSIHRPSLALNIFNRIKEIYEACSCKVCECVTTKPLLSSNEVCNCKPCDCDDCVNLRTDIESHIKQIPSSGCPCVSCDRKDCRGITKDAAEPQPCDCDVSEPCHCEPCQCIKCKSLNDRALKTVKIAQFDEIFLRELCHCSPCDCIECKQIYNRTNPIVMCTNPTDKQIFSNCRCDYCTNEQCQLDEEEKCTCEMYNRIVKKTFQKGCNDYDVHSIIVDSTGSIPQQSHSIFENHNTVALFATLKNNNLKHLSDKTLCKCIECECIVCNGKKETLMSESNTYLKSNGRHSNKVSMLPAPIMNACKCSPCECEICTRKSGEDSATIQSKCKCDICDCLNCDNTTSFQHSNVPTPTPTTKKMAKPIKKMNINNNCDCHPCECNSCDKLLSCASHSSVKFYSRGKVNGGKASRRVRKVMLISPCTSESHLNTDKANHKSVSVALSMNTKRFIKDVDQLNVSSSHYIAQNPHVPQIQSTNNKTHEDFQLNENSKDNKFNYIALERHALFNLNDPALKTKSCSSIREEPIFNQRNEFNVMNITTRKTAENNQNIECEAKSLNYIHESPVKVYSHGSDDSVSMFGIRPDETSHPGAFPEDIKSNCEMPASTPINDYKLRLIKMSQLKHEIALTSYVGNKQIDPCEIFGNTETNQTVFDSGNSSQKYVESSNHCRNVGYNVNNINIDHNILHLESNKFNDTLPLPMIHKNRNFLIHSDLAVSYEKATQVLREAKAFSSKLVKMLDSFEKANREFKSASLKFKNLHNSLLDINEDHNTSLRATFTNIQQNNSEPEGTPKSIIKDENEPEKEYEQSMEPIEISNDLKENQDIKSLGILDMKNDIKVISKSDHLTVTKTEINREPVQYSELSIKREPRSIQKFVDATSRKPTKISLKNSKTSLLRIPTSTDIAEKSFAQTLFSEEPTRQESFNEKAQQEQTVLPLNKELVSVFDNNTKVDDAVTIETVKDYEEYPKQGDKKSWDVLRKNLDLELPAERKVTLIGLPALELDIKETIGAITLQTPNQAKLSKPVPRANEALAHLLTEVSNLLSMPLLQPNSQIKNEVNIKVDTEFKSTCSAASSQTYNRIVTTADKENYFNGQQNSEFQNDFYRFSRYNGNYPRVSYSTFNPKVMLTTHSKKIREDDSSNINPYKSNCEEFKVRFVALRRISDHTVLIKWNVPKRVKDIQGYEVLVDGRAVQRILSPARRAAVLSGLPRAARLLLTVRTLAAAPGCDHAPAATALYRPLPPHGQIVHSANFVYSQQTFRNFSN